MNVKESAWDTSCPVDAEVSFKSRSEFFLSWPVGEDTVWFLSFAAGPGEVGGLGLSVELAALAVGVQKAPRPVLLAQTLPSLKRTSGPRGKARGVL